VERERGVILEEYKRYWDMRADRADMLFAPLLFGKTPLAHTVIGTPKTIKTFQQEDLKQWHQNKYSADEVTISIAGKFGKSIESQIGNSFKELPQNGAPIAVAAPNLINDGPRILMDEFKSDQINLIMGFLAPKIGDSKLWALKVLNSIMSGGMSTRLFKEIREKRGLCYTISMSYRALADTGFVTVYAGLDERRINEAVEAIWQELQKIANTPPSRHELKRTKDKMIGATTLSLEDYNNLATGFMNEWMYDGEVTSLDEKEQKVLAVTPEQISSLARELFDSKKMGMVLVGKKQDTAKLAKIFA